MKWRVEWVFWACLGCGDGVQQAQPVDCDPISDTGCPVNTHCRLLDEGARACLAMEASPEGCTPASCAPGEACVTVEGHTACHPICEVEGEACGATGLCAYPITGSPWSACIQPCELGRCSAGATCAPVDLPFPICVAAGRVGAGEPCSDARCAVGLACLLQDDIPRCRPLCRPGVQADCPVGQCVGVIRDQPTLQFCQE